MKKEKKANHEFVLYFSIVLACILAVYIMLSTDLNPNRSSFDMYFTHYPEQIKEGQNLSFSLAININDSLAPLTLSVLFDGIEQENMSIVNPSLSAITLNLSLENNFKAGERHEITVNLYDEAKTYHQYGSPSKPYYIFFRVDVV